MIIIETEAKKWGNSMGIILPKEVVEHEHIREREKIMFFIIKDGRKVLKETFGLAKGKLNKSAQQMKDELRAELYD